MMTGLVLKETKEPADDDMKKDKVEKVEKVEKYTDSTFSTKSTPLMIKGMSLESAGNFKMLARMLNLKYSELMEHLLAVYFDNNPLVEDRLTKKPVYFQVIPKNHNGPQRSRELDLKIKELKELLNKLGSREYILRVVKGSHGKNVPSKLYRREIISQVRALRIHLDDRKLPEEQRQEIAEFIDAYSGQGKDTEGQPPSEAANSPRRAQDDAERGGSG